MQPGELLFEKKTCPNYSLTTRQPSRVSVRVRCGRSQFRYTVRAIRKNVNIGTRSSIGWCSALNGQYWGNGVLSTWINQEKLCPVSKCQTFNGLGNCTRPDHLASHSVSSPLKQLDLTAYSHIYRMSLAALKCTLGHVVSRRGSSHTTANWCRQTLINSNYDINHFGVYQIQIFHFILTYFKPSMFSMYYDFMFAKLPCFTQIYKNYILFSIFNSKGERVIEKKKRVVVAVNRSPRNQCDLGLFDQSR